MFEYEIYNRATDEYKYIYGYDIKDAFWRCPGKINPDDWEVVYSEYID